MYIHSTKQEALWLVAYSNPARKGPWIQVLADGDTRSRWLASALVMLQPMIVEHQGLIMMLLPHCQCWYAQRNLTFYWKILEVFILWKMKKNSLAPQWYEIPTRAIYWHVFKNLTHMLLVLHWALSNCLRPLWDSFHAFKIKITYTPYILMLTSRLEVTQKHACHSHQNTPSL